MEPLPDIGAWRRDTRKRLIAERLRLTPSDHASASAHVEAALEALLGRYPPQVIGAYWPYRGEVDVRPLMQRLRDRGWTTALPSVVGAGQPMEYLHWDSASVMGVGAYDIPVPQERSVVVPTLVLAPLVAFDEAKYRLGYGAGYFDITLAALSPRPQSIGVGFESGRLETIYPNATDIPMDVIVTDTGVA